jgi:hypothetical protein
MRKILSRGKVFQVSGIDFFVTSVVMVKTFNREYSIVVFYSEQMKSDSANYRSSVKKYWIDFIKNYFAEHVIMLIALENALKNTQLKIWYSNKQIEILSEENP